MEENKRYNVLRMTLTRDQIGSFVAGLHEIQQDMIESVVATKESQGFPDVQAILEHVMKLK
jgi:hypothetical protein